MNTKNYIRKTITITKPITMETQGGAMTYEKGEKLWEEKGLAYRINDDWPVNEKGFIFEHFHSYGQAEIFPWENIELKTETWDEVTTVENEKTETIEAGEFNFNAKAAATL